MAPTGIHKSRRRKAGRSRLPKVLLVLGLIGGGTYAGMVYFGHPPPVRPGVNDVTSNDAQQQATLVGEEEQRIMQTNAVLTSTLQRGGAAAAQMRLPHNASSANGKTLLLPQRSAPYYVSDLERYGQQDFQKQSDGSYLLGVNVFVANGAKLVLQSATGPLTIRMRSVPGSFSSIVSFGGSIRINGSAQNPVLITSWNDQTRQPDTQVADGRAYIRSIGGEFQMKYAQITDLGFWSGRTGGIALTGTDRPDTSAQQYASWQPTTKRLLLPNGQVDTTGGGSDQVEVSPAGKVGTSAGFLVPTANLITGFIENSKIVGNAYGIFVSVSNQIQIVDNTIEGSLVDGVLMHRFARNSSIENTTVTGSRGDGFVLSRATESVRITGCTANNNGGNGFTLDGQPLAQGPTASGASTEAFGGSSVTSSTATNNARYGVELLGGSNLAVQTSKISGGDMGIVVRNRATGVQISGNELTGQARQGIVLRDGVVSARVAGNIVNGTKTAIYLRDSSGSITGNTVQSASRHGISLMGSVAGSRITGNTFAGAGTSVLDAGGSHGTTIFTNNDSMGWHNTAGFWTEVKRVAKPMNIVWASVFLIVIVSAVRSRSSGLRIGRLGVHPYVQQVALAERPVYRLRREPVGPAGQIGPPDNTAAGRYGSLGGNQRGGAR